MGRYPLAAITKLDELPANWQRIVMAIPSYNPFAQADGCYFLIERANNIIRFIERVITHVKGQLAGKPLKLQLWQKAVVANLFGWLRADGTRRYRSVFLFLPRKNGKSTLSAAMVVVVLITDNEPGAEIYSAAGDRAQASLVFDIAKGMVGNDEDLRKQLHVYQKAIVDAKQGAGYKPISADSWTKHGYNAHCVVVDELHTQPNRDLVDVLETSTGSRDQPIMLYVTTAGDDLNSICREKYEDAIEVRDNGGDRRKSGYDPALLPVIFEALEGRWDSPAVWRKANPNLGVSLRMDYLRRTARKARSSPALQQTFERLHLNRWVQAGRRWLHVDAWDHCQAEFDLSQLKGQACNVGLDLSATTDLTAAVAVFEDEPHSVCAMHWTPAEGIEDRQRRWRAPLAEWRRAGYLRTVPGRRIHSEPIVDWLRELAAVCPVRRVAIDPWGATDVITQLEAAGFAVVTMRQGFATISAPTKRTEAMILSGELRHDGDPVLRWCLNNAAAKMDDAENVKLVKGKSRGRIDGAIALIEAIGLTMLGEPEPTKSVYGERGLVLV